MLNFFLTAAVAECEKYALESTASVVISASSLKYLANNYPPYSQPWMLPVKVKAYNMTGEVFLLTQ